MYTDASACHCGAVVSAMDGAGGGVGHHAACRAWVDASHRDMGMGVDTLCRR